MKKCVLLNVHIYIYLCIYIYTDGVSMERIPTTILVITLNPLLKG